MHRTQPVSVSILNRIICTEQQASCYLIVLYIYSFSPFGKVWFAKGNLMINTLTKLGRCNSYIIEWLNTGCFFNWYPPKKLKYVKPRLGESTLT